MAHMRTNTHTHTMLLCAHMHSHTCVCPFSHGFGNMRSACVCVCPKMYATALSVCGHHIINAFLLCVFGCGECCAWLCGLCQVCVSEERERERDRRGDFLCSKLISATYERTGIFINIVRIYAHMLTFGCMLMITSCASLSPGTR